MRLPTAVASILVVGLVAAACGGDDPTPEPADEATAAPVATEAAEEPAEEVTEAPAEETTEAPAEEVTEAPAEEVTEAPAEEATAVVAAEFLTKAQVDQDADPEATYGLTSGRYRMQWSTTDCEQIDLLVKQVDGDFEYAKPSTATFASATVNDVPEGTYTIQQLDDSCAEWSVRIDRMSA